MEENARFFYFIFILLIFLISCQFQSKLITFNYTQIPATSIPIKEIPVYIDKHFSQSDKEIIKKVIRQWNYVLNGYIVMHIANTEFNMELDTMRKAIDGKIYLILKIDNNNIILNNLDGTNKKTLGMVNKIGGNWIYLVRDNILDQDLFYITLHEFAHLFGAKHNKSYLMNANYNRSYFQCIDKNTVLQVASYYNLSITDLNYCIYL